MWLHAHSPRARQHSRTLDLPTTENAAKLVLRKRKAGRQKAQLTRETKRAGGRNDMRTKRARQDGARAPLREIYQPLAREATTRTSGARPRRGISRRRKDHPHQTAQQMGRGCPLRTKCGCYWRRKSPPERQERQPTPDAGREYRPESFWRLPGGEWTRVSSG